MIFSRGELVEIGGSFRIPEIMEQSGAILREVGATNRTHPRDYRSAITDETALLLKMHAGNFVLVGFTAQVLGRISQGVFVLDLRTITDKDIPDLIAAFLSVTTPS